MTPSQRFEMLTNAVLAQPATWLVTGGAGFIGSHIVEALLERGNQKVIVFDNFSSGSRDNLKHCKNLNNLSLVEGDIRSHSDVMNLFLENEIEYVLHQAAIGSVPRSVADPVPTLMANVMGFVNLIDVARRHKPLSRIVYASSSSVYGQQARLPQTEGQEGRVLSPYAASKRAMEHLADAATASYLMDLVGLRYFNVFGARQKGAVIPEFLSKIRAGQPIDLFGGGRSRDFTYIKNVVYANVFAATQSLSTPIMNVCSGRPIALEQAYSSLLEAAQTPGKGVRLRPPRPGDIMQSHGSIELGYSQGLQLIYSFEEGVKELCHSLS